MTSVSKKMVGVGPDAHQWDNFWRKAQRPSLSTMSWSKRRILKILDSFMRKDRKVLDAGCGSGFFSKHFCDQGMQTASVDFSDRALEMTTVLTGGRARVIKEDLCASDLGEKFTERFDLIFSDGLLEHFVPEEQDKIIKNFVGLLSQEGILVTFVPNRWSPWQLIRPIFMPGIDETPFVLRTLVSLQTHAGLKILDSGGINVLPFAFSPDRTLGRLFGMLLYTTAKKDV